MRSPSAPSHYCIPVLSTHTSILACSLCLALLGMLICVQPTPHPQLIPPWVFRPWCPWPLRQFCASFKKFLIIKLHTESQHLHVCIPTPFISCTTGPPVASVCVQRVPPPVKRVWSPGNPVLTRETWLLILLRTHASFVQQLPLERPEMKTTDSFIGIL